MIKYIRRPFDNSLIDGKYFNELEKINIKKNKITIKELVSEIKTKSKFVKIVSPHLVETFHSKCAFCESKLIDNSEHFINYFRPQFNSRDITKEYSELHYWWLTLEYRNTYFSCSECSENKGNWFPVIGDRCELGDDYRSGLKEKNLLFDPCNDEPELDFKYTITGKITTISLKGKTTIDILKLNRESLVKGRRSALHRQKEYLNSILHDPKEIKRMLNNVFFENNEEYLGIIRFFIRKQFKELSNLYPELNSIIETINKSYRDSQFEYSRLQNLNWTPSQQQEYDSINENESLRNNFIKEIEIKNFRGIKNLKLNISSEDEGNPCVFIIGENGTGKSSILKAIALALSNSRYYNSILQKFNISDGSGKGFIKIMFDNNKSTSLHFLYDNNTFQPAYNNTFSHNTVIGYGSSRLAKLKSVYKEEKNKFDNKLKNLFNPSTPLNDPIAWLFTLSNKDFSSATERLAEILDLESSKQIVKKDRNEILIKRKSKFTPFNQLSDGNKVLFNIACDLMSSLNSESGDYNDIEAIVIIDEIENHLHPRWKMRITSQLRATFPNIQFIFSTHDPLCLKGAKKGEVILLKENAKGNIETINELPNPSLLTAEQLLTSEYFGLFSTLDIKVEENFNNYYKLLSIKNKSEEVTNKINEFKTMLKSEGQFGKTLRDELMYSVIDKMIATQLFEPKPESRIKLKEDTYNLIKASFDNL